MNDSLRAMKRDCAKCGHEEPHCQCVGMPDYRLPTVYGYPTGDGDKPEYPAWLREAASKGGKKSRRKLSTDEAQRISKIGWQKRKALTHEQHAKLVNASFTAEIMKRKNK